MLMAPFERFNLRQVATCRCVTIHGTHYVKVERNVAFDVTGHCYYLEDGVEERNELRHNLAAHVHPMIDPVARTPTGTECDSQRCADVAPDAEKLAVPVDVTASGFYITNAYNVSST